MNSTLQGDSHPVVVCVEDDRETINFISLALRRSGYTFIGVANPSEALLVLQRYTPDLVLLDIMLPDVSGWEVYRRMRADPRLENVPVIIITARASQVDRIYGEQVARVDEYILKPFAPSDLRAAIARVLDKKEKTEQAE